MQLLQVGWTILVCGKQRESKELSVPPLLLLWKESPVLSLGNFQLLLSLTRSSQLVVLDSPSPLQLVISELCLGKLKPGEPVWPAACDTLHQELFGSVLSFS